MHESLSKLHWKHHVTPEQQFTIFTVIKPSQILHGHWHGLTLWRIRHCPLHILRVMNGKQEQWQKVTWVLMCLLMCRQLRHWWRIFCPSLTRRHQFHSQLSRLSSCSLWHIFAWNFTRTKNHTPQAILVSKFNSHKIQDGGGRLFEIDLNGHNSVIVERIRTKFGTGTKKDVPKTVLPSDFTSDKIQDGGRRHFENWFNGYISDNVTCICMKFCKRTKIGVTQSIVL